MIICPKLQLVVGLLLFGLGLLGCERRSADTAELEKEIERLENVVANQRLSLEELGGLSFDALGEEEPITKRHLVIATWYADQDLGFYYIGREMNHDWGPRWNRRSPLSILDEQTRVMQRFLDETRALEDSSSRPPTYPTERDTSPDDGARIHWENFIEKDGKRENPPVWFGKNAKTGAWMVFQHGEGVSNPSSEQLEEIERIKAEESKGERFD